MPKKRQFSILPGAQLNLEKERVSIPCLSLGQKKFGTFFSFQEASIESKGPAAEEILYKCKISLQIGLCICQSKYVSFSTDRSDTEMSS